MAEAEQNRTTESREQARSYSAPELREWGTIIELTAAGETNPGGDCFSGSVFPGGHQDGCPPAKGKSF